MAQSPIYLSSWYGSPVPGVSVKNYRKSGRVEISKVSRTKTLLPRKKRWKIWKSSLIIRNRIPRANFESRRRQCVYNWSSIFVRSEAVFRVCFIVTQKVFDLFFLQAFIWFDLIWFLLWRVHYFQKKYHLVSLSFLWLSIINIFSTMSTSRFSCKSIKWTKQKERKKFQESLGTYKKRGQGGCLKKVNKGLTSVVKIGNMSGSFNLVQTLPHAETDLKKIATFCCWVERCVPGNVWKQEMSRSCREENVQEEL